MDILLQSTIKFPFLMLQEQSKQSASSLGRSKASKHEKTKAILREAIVYSSSSTLLYMYCFPR